MKPFKDFILEEVPLTEEDKMLIEASFKDNIVKLIDMAFFNDKAYKNAVERVIELIKKNENPKNPKHSIEYYAAAVSREINGIDRKMLSNEVKKILVV